MCRAVKTATVHVRVAIGKHAICIKLEKGTTLAHASRQKIYSMVKCLKIIVLRIRDVMFTLLKHNCIAHDLTKTDGSDCYTSFSMHKRAICCR